MYLEEDQIAHVHGATVKGQGAAALAVPQVEGERLPILPGVLLGVEQQPEAPLLRCAEAVGMEEVPPREQHLPPQVHTLKRQLGHMCLTRERLAPGGEWVGG